MAALRVWDKIEDATAAARRAGLAPRVIRLSEADHRALSDEVREAFPSRAYEWSRVVEQSAGVGVERGSADTRSAVVADTEFPL